MHAHLPAFFCWLCIPDQNGQPFRSKVGDHSGPKWAAIPPENGRILSNATTPTVYENHIRPG